MVSENEIASFKDVDFPKQTDLRGGGVPWPKKISGLKSFGSLTLKRGLTQGSFLIDWWDEVKTRDGGLEGLAKTVTLNELNDEGSVVNTWTFDDCVPSSLKAGGTDKNGHTRIKELGFLTRPKEKRQHPAQGEATFELPLGYLDEQGFRHRQGVMRLAVAGDEILPLKDPRVQSNPAYLAIIILARVVTRLGHLGYLDTDLIENLSLQDFEYLQNFYQLINGRPLPSLVDLETV